MVAPQPEKRVSPVDYDSGSDLVAYGVSYKWIRESSGLRLDASHYNPTLAQAMSDLDHSGMELVRLGDITERVFIPPRCKRVYVQSSHGLPFLQGSHIMHFQPADIKYVSRTAQKNVEMWVIREGWLLITRSGTVGRCAIAPPTWDGWAASEHILRIIPAQDGPCPTGYLYAYLCSPIGQAQLTAQIYGAVVDEITEEQARGVMVPIARTDEEIATVARIHELALESVRERDRASRLATEALTAASEFIKTEHKGGDGPPTEGITRDEFFAALDKVSRPLDDRSGAMPDLETTGTSE